MKKIFPFILAVFMVACSAQKKHADQSKAVVISAKGSVGTKDYQLQIKEIVSDSRCPEDVTCVWAGEIKLIVSVNKGKQFIEAAELTIASKQFKENTIWFSRYLPAGEIKSIVVLPQPKEGIPKELKDYSILIQYD